MRIMATRRGAMAGAAAALTVSAAWAGQAVASSPIDIFERFAELERRHGGRLGVSVLEAASGRRWSHRDDERFAMCSTFKFSLAAMVLARCDGGKERLERRITFSQKDLVKHGGKVLWSPKTEGRTGGAGMTVAELCAAAVSYSDNTAANLLLGQSGGPSALTAYLRALGDDVTRLDRIEPALNEATPGDPRDTTTPRAMADVLYKTVLGDALTPSSREQLTGWLVGNTTGDKRLRAGLPVDWRVGDKTGTGRYGVTNDIAVVWPLSAAAARSPLLVTVYYAESKATPDQRDAVIADVGRLLTLLA